jgi:hypothetical protein
MMMQQQPAAPPPPPAGGMSGSMTDLFQSPLAGGNPMYNLPPSANTPLAPPPAKPVDEFKDLFGGVNAEARPAPPGMSLGSTPASLTATSGFQAPAGPGAGMPPPPAAGPSAAIKPAHAAGSFTQIMQSPLQPEAAKPLLGQQPVTPPQTRAAKKGIPPWVLATGFAVVFIAIMVVLVLILKK